MPEGPLGLPRLTTLGPFVKPSSIEPAVDISEDIYPLQFILDNQEYTGEDTQFILEDYFHHVFEIPHKDVEEEVLSTEYRYHKRQISEIIEINEFSKALLEAMSKAEEMDIELKGEEERYEIKNEELYNEIEKQLDGNSDLFTDELLSDIDDRWGRIEELATFRGKSEVIGEIKEKVAEDFHRVVTINEDIRSNNIYYPPTTENIDLGAPLDFGTLDGAHRIVALSQILGGDESVFVWEWSNEQMFLDRFE